MEPFNIAITSFDLRNAHKTSNNNVTTKCRRTTKSLMSLTTNPCCAGLENHAPLQEFRLPPVSLSVRLRCQQPELDGGPRGRTSAPSYRYVCVCVRVCSGERTVAGQ